MSRKQEIQKLRQVLLNRRDALQQALAGDMSSLQELKGQPGGDAIDVALDSAQGEISSQLAEIESRELSKVENALNRMGNGTYGICEATGKPIPLARLKALPYATLCIEAQRELEMSGESANFLPDWGRILDNSGDNQAFGMNEIELS